MWFLPILLWTNWLAMAFAAENENERQYQHELDHDEREHTNLRSRHNRLLQQTTGNPFDMAFIMDESIGMSSVQNTFKSNVPLLFSHLAARASGSRAGLVGYGYNTIRILQELTNSSYSFWNAASKLVSGSTSAPTSPGYRAIYQTVKRSSFTRNRPFCVVLFSNKGSDQDPGITLQKVMKTLQNAPGTPNQANARGVFFVVTTWEGKLVFNSYGPLATATGGKTFSENDFISRTNYTLNEIVMECNLAVNQITLTPSTANLSTTDGMHTLTIITRQKCNLGLCFRSNANVTLLVLDGPNAGLLSTGTTESNGTMQFRYTPSPTLKTTTTIKFQACLVDSPNACVTADTTWTAPPNHPPLANNDFIIMQEDTAVNISVTVNDVDPDGDLLAVVIQTQPSHGNLSVNSDGRVKYRPSANYDGPDNFTYTLTDGKGGTSQPAIVSINVLAQNDPPVANSDSAQTRKGTAVIIPVLNNDFDPDEDVLVIANVTQPVFGSATVDWTRTTVTYMPRGNYGGPDYFTYTVSDGKGGISLPATVVIGVFAV